MSTLYMCRCDVCGEIAEKRTVETFWPQVFKYYRTVQDCEDYASIDVCPACFRKLGDFLISRSGEDCDRPFYGDSETLIKFFKGETSTDKEEQHG